MTLVVCCGSLLCGDDAVAWTIADRLADEGQDLRIETCHALAPELAVVVAAAATVVFVDARVGDSPGRVRCNRVDAAQIFATPRHGESPERILALAHELYASTPDAYLVTIGARRLEFGAELSPEVVDSVPHALALIKELTARSMS